MKSPPKQTTGRMVAPSMFKEEALEWYRCLDDAKRKVKTWDQLRNMMLVEFLPSDYEKKLRVKLRAMVQEEGMAVKTYVRELKRIFIKLPLKKEEKLEDERIFI